MLSANENRRRLLAILAADAAGYSRSMALDDAATVAALDDVRGVFKQHVESNQGRVVDTAGDSVLAVFETATGAVSAALAVQEQLQAHSRGITGVPPMRFRIGVHLGEVIEKPDGSVYGDGVNIAARLQALAEPGGITVSEAVHALTLRRLPVAFKDTGRHAVKNIPEPVQVYRVAALPIGARAHGAEVAVGRSGVRWQNRRLWLSTTMLLVALLVAGGIWVFLHGYPEPPLPSSASVSVSAIPSIAVLPLSNLSSDTSKDYYADGITEDIIYALGRFSGITVIARSAVQDYKGRNVSREKISSELGVRYLLQGSVRMAGERLRVAVELSDADRGTLLWSERYDGEGKDIFSIQDRIVTHLVGTLAVQLTHLEQERTHAKPTESLEAYDLVLRAREMLRRADRADRASNRQARELLVKALQLAPDYAQALVAMAEAEYLRATAGWVEDAAEGVRRSQSYAKRAFASDDRGARARAHAQLARSYSFFHQFEQGLVEADRAIELNPNDAFAHALRGALLVWMGRLDEGIAALETARRFDPRPGGDQALGLGLAYYLRGRYRDAVAISDVALAHRDLAFLHAVKAAALAQLDSTEAAREAAAAVRKLDPFFSLDSFGTRFANPEHQAKLQEGLRKAGL